MPCKSNVAWMPILSKLKKEKGGIGHVIEYKMMVFVFILSVLSTPPVFLLVFIRLFLSRESALMGPDTHFFKQSINLILKNKKMARLTDHFQNIVN